METTSHPTSSRGFTIQSKLLRIDTDEDEDAEEEAVEVMVTPPSAKPLSSIANFQREESVSPTANFRSKPNSTVVLPAASGPSHAKDLSIIAEIDEIEKSRAVSPQKNGPVIHDNSISYKVRDPTNPDVMNTVTVPYYEDDRSFFDSEPTTTTASFPLDPFARDYETHELPAVISDSAQPTIQTHPPDSPAPTTLTRKPSIPVFPTLPMPSPLHKSTRESTTMGYGQPSTTGGTGTRKTSWLQKARDVKRTSVVTGPGPGPKRKSGELLDVDSSAAYGRATKIAKTSIEDGVTDALAIKDKGKQPDRPTIPPFKPISRELPLRETYTVQVPSNTEENTDGMIDILKRTIDTMGARAGKSFGKSLGGTAATAAAAEAKAAAEARLAQRDAKGSDDARQGRLSVSDLIGNFEGDSSKPKTSEPHEARERPPSNPPRAAIPQVSVDSRMSISTTPPDSPPPSHAQAAAYDLPSLRLVTELPPRLVSNLPPQRPATIPVPKFQVQRPFSAQPSYASLQSESQSPSQQQSQSTQGTYVSAIFDRNNTWTQSSLDTDYSQGYTQTQTLPDSQSYYEEKTTTVTSTKEIRPADGYAHLTIFLDICSHRTV